MVLLRGAVSTISFTRALVENNPALYRAISQSQEALRAFSQVYSVTHSFDEDEVDNEVESEVPATTSERLESIVFNLFAENITENSELFSQSIITKATSALESNSISEKRGYIIDIFEGADETIRAVLIFTIMNALYALILFLMAGNTYEEDDEEEDDDADDNDEDEEDRTE